MTKAAGHSSTFNRPDYQNTLEIKLRLDEQRLDVQCHTSVQIDISDIGFGRFLLVSYRTVISFPSSFPFRLINSSSAELLQSMAQSYMRVNGREPTRVVLSAPSLGEWELRNDVNEPDNFSSRKEVGSDGRY